MVKQISKYKNKQYVNEANYSAGILIADIWKETLDFKVGDVLRIIHRGKKNPNRIHLERIPIQEKYRLIKIHKRGKGEGFNYDKFIGSEYFYVPLDTAINLIKKAFKEKEFTSRQLTYWIFWSEDFGIQELMEEKGVERFYKRYSTCEFLKKLCKQGFLKKRDEILNPIPDNLGRFKKRIWYKLPSNVQQSTKQSQGEKQQPCIKDTNCAVENTMKDFKETPNELNIKGKSDSE